MTWKLVTEEQSGYACDGCKRHVADAYWFDEDADFVACSTACFEARDQQVAETQAAQA